MIVLDIHQHLYISLICFNIGWGREIQGMLLASAPLHQQKKTCLIPLIPSYSLLKPKIRGISYNKLKYDKFFFPDVIKCGIELQHGHISTIHHEIEL